MERNMETNNTEEKIRKVLSLIEEKSKLLEFIDQEIRVKGNKDENIVRESWDEIHEIESEIKVLYNEIGSVEKIEEVLGDDLNWKVGNAIQEIQKIAEEENPPLENLKETGSEVLEKVKGEMGEIKDGGQKIDDTLSDRDSLEADKIRRESGGIIDEAAGAGGEAREGVDEIVGNTGGFDAHRMIKKGDESVQRRENEIKERREEWDGKNEEERREEIEKTRIRVESDQRVRELEAIISGGADSIGDYQNKLQEEAEDIVTKRAAMMEKISGVDTSQSSGLEELRTGMIGLMSGAEKELTTAKLDYLKECLADDGLGDLTETHLEREIKIEELEKLAKRFEETMKEFEKIEEMGEEEKEKAKKEVQKYVDELVDELEKDPKLWEALGPIIAGLAILASLVGVCADKLLKFVSKATKAGIKGGKFLAGGLLAGILMCIDYLDEEKRDKIAKGVAGVDLPGWYFDLVPKNSSSNKLG